MRILLNSIIVVFFLLFIDNDTVFCADTDFWFVPKTELHQKEEIIEAIVVNEFYHEDDIIFCYGTLYGQYKSDDEITKFDFKTRLGPMDFSTITIKTKENDAFKDGWIDVKCKFARL